MIIHALAAAAILNASQPAASTMGPGRSPVLATAANQPRPPDPWFAEDKLKHFAASFVVSSLTASGARALGLDRRQSLAVGVGVGLTAGLVKEISDARGGLGFSVKDILWDIAGVSAAAAVLDASR